jgi:amino acid permease
MQAGPRVEPHSNILTLGLKDLGGNPQHDRISFRYWRDPGLMGKYLEETVGKGKFATFLGFWSVMSR